MTTTTRAEKKPPFLPQWLWDASVCLNSPSGSHHWMLRTYKVDADAKGRPNGSCAYCPKMYLEVYGGKRRRVQRKVDAYGKEHELSADSRAARIEAGL